MSTRSRAVLPLAILGAVAVAATGAAAIIDRVLESRRGRRPAPDGTPRIEGRLPLALWPSSGREPMVARGPRGWREMLDALHHPDTVVDEAQRARAIVIAERPRRDQHTRRARALEAHVLLGSYEPSLVAAAWLQPLHGVSFEDLAAFGLSDVTIATLRAAELHGADPEVLLNWRRELGIDPLHAEITPGLVSETATDRLGMLWAVLLHLADERIAARHPA